MNLLSKVGAALRAGRSVTTIDRALAAGEIKPQRIGGRILFDVAEVDRWLGTRQLPVCDRPETIMGNRG